MRLRLTLCLTLVMLSGSVCARVLTVGSLVPSSYADTEVATNVAFNVVRNDIREMDVRIDFDGSVSNCVEVAFGCDWDGDGDLALGESDLALGWYGGRYCVEHVPESERFLSAEPAVTDVPWFLRLQVRTGVDFKPVGAFFSCDAGACFTDIAFGVPAWLCRPEWNLIRITRSGPDAPHEWCRIDATYNELILKVR